MTEAEDKALAEALFGGPAHARIVPPPANTMLVPKAEYPLPRVGDIVRPDNPEIKMAVVDGVMDSGDHWLLQLRFKVAVVHTPTLADSWARHQFYKPHDWSPASVQGEPDACARCGERRGPVITECKDSNAPHPESPR